VRSAARSTRFSDLADTGDMCVHIYRGKGGALDVRFLGMKHVFRFIIGEGQRLAGCRGLRL